MINLQRFKNYKEFFECYKKIKKQLGKVRKKVEKTEDYIRGNDNYLLNPTEEYIQELNLSLANGKINIFKYYDDLNHNKFEYVDYLLKEFTHSSIYSSYALLLCATIIMERIIREMCSGKDLSPETVYEINNKIFEQYQLKLSQEI